MKTSVASFAKTAVEYFSDLVVAIVRDVAAAPEINPTLIPATFVDFIGAEWQRRVSSVCPLLSHHRLKTSNRAGLGSVRGSFLVQDGEIDALAYTQSDEG